ncbi:fibronectin type III domain-containing protein [Dyadobacter sp. SG02]|uniref:fibronectin type III domain-containing protein n=1 Tax=Dyadobacter sp. SG02 TaxID=1855291 RepID=UPI001E2F27E5|nr:fibronectin type III domain-containing protein [Dyadobacter sp. SG02]
MVSKLELVDIKRTEITVSGNIQNPDAKNDRQEKKSGGILEYGIVYGTSAALDVQKDKVLKLGEKPAQVPILIQNQKITGLAADTRYFVALYARNEGGGMAYSEIVEVKTTLSPPIKVTRNSVKISNRSGLAYDLDEGNIVVSSDPKADVGIDIFTITGRGTTLSLESIGNLRLKTLGVAEYDKISYLDLALIQDLTTAGVGYLVNAQSANTVIAFRTGEGRLGKWRLENASANELTISLVTYDN